MRTFTFMRLPKPYELGLPKRFKDWRPNQPKAIRDGLDSKKRFVVQSQRQGQGKTLTYFAQGLIDEGSRYIYLTSTKGLQDQNLEVYGEAVGLADIRGKSTYDCDLLTGHSCAEGSVAGCAYKGSGMCGYSAARFEASRGRLVSSNYSCWIASNKYSQGFGKFDVMVCDEAHNAPSEIEKAMRVTLGEREICEQLGRDWPDYRSLRDMEAWKYWARVTHIVALKELQRLEMEIKQAKSKEAGAKRAKEYNHYQNLVRRLADIATCRPEAWVADEWLHGYCFDPIDPSEYAERVLFRSVPKVLFHSGTFATKSLIQLGIDLDDVDYFEYPSEVDPARTPVMYIPTERVNKDSQPWQLQRIVNRIDEIFASRMDRKGIVHTSNYKIRDFIMEHSRFAKFFVSNYVQVGDITSHVVENFKAMKPPALLVTPSVTTGYDFPYDMCRYQIIAKLNYPYAVSRVEQERMKLDPERGSYHAIIQLQQAATRGDRADDDFQEVFIIDDAFPYLRKRHENLFDRSFLACIRTAQKVPPPPDLD